MSQPRSILWPVAFGIFSSLSAIILDAWLRQHFGADLMQTWVNLIIPFGAICLGLLASLGFIAGARLSNFPARNALLGTMLIVALVSFILLHIIEYYTDSVGGISVHKLIGLGDYLKTIFTHGTMKLSHESDAHTFDLGRGGFILPLGNALGFMGGMFAGFLMLRAMPHCAKCRSYFDTVSRQSLTFRDDEQFIRFHQNLPSEPYARLDYLSHFNNGYSPAISKKGMWTFTLEHNRCPNCHDQFVTETSRIHTGKNYQIASDFSGSYFLTRLAKDPLPAATFQPTVQFGRRTSSTP
jgi:hypothetical protein